MILIVNIGAFFPANDDYDAKFFSMNFARRTVLKKGNQRIHLIGMSHLAQDGFYQGIKSYLGKLPNATTLMEGVTDKENLIGDLGYKDLGSASGLTLQTETLTEDTFPNPRNADLDVEDLSPETREILKAFSKMYSGGGLEQMSLIRKKLAGLSKRGQEHSFHHNIITLRNKNLIKHLETELKASTTDVVIPWGSDHLKEVHDHLEKKGFKEEHSSYHYTNSSISLLWAILVSTN